MKILIAEDDEPTRRLLEMFLKRMRHEVTSTASGQERWNAFRKGYFPVLITDWMMPEMDGLSLCRAIRKVQRDQYTIIILLTSLSGKANYLEAMEAGADDFMTKPFDADQLAARLQVAERILGLRRHVRQIEGLLPICAWCKKIRDPSNQWQPIETYVEQRSTAQFSHGLCPECGAKMLQQESA